MILSAGSECKKIAITDFVDENSTFGIYDSKKSEQKFSDTNPTDNKCSVSDEIDGGKYITSIKNPDTKECRTYCYKDGTLVFVCGGGAGGKAAVYTAENFTNGGLSISKSGS